MDDVLVRSEVTADGYQTDLLSHLPQRSITRNRFVGMLGKGEAELTIDREGWLDKIDVSGIADLDPHVSPRVFMDQEKDQVVIVFLPSRFFWGE